MNDLVDPDLRTCPGCLSTLIDAEDRFCWYCGTPLPEPLAHPRASASAEANLTNEEAPTAPRALGSDQRRLALYAGLAALLVIASTFTILRFNRQGSTRTEASNRPAVTVPARPSPTVRATAVPTASQPRQQVAVVTDTKGAKLRSKPAKEGAVRATVENGKRLVVLSGPLAAGGAEWFEIEMKDGVSTWVKADDVRIEPAAASEVAQSDSGTSSSPGSAGPTKVASTVAASGQDPSTTGQCSMGIDGIRFLGDDQLLGDERMAVLESFLSYEPSMFTGPMDDYIPLLDAGSNDLEIKGFSIFRAEDEDGCGGYAVEILANNRASSGMEYADFIFDPDEPKVLPLNDLARLFMGFDCEYRGCPGRPAD